MYTNVLFFLGHRTIYTHTQSLQISRYTPLYIVLQHFANAPYDALDQLFLPHFSLHVHLIFVVTLIFLNSIVIIIVSGILFFPNSYKLQQMLPFSQ